MADDSTLWRWIFGEWGLLLATVIACLLYARHLWKKISNLVSYSLSLLASDAFRSAEKRRFEQWMKTEDWKTPAAMAIRTSMFVLRSADGNTTDEPIELRAPCPTAVEQKVA